jgi:hypothetical protein
MKSGKPMFTGGFIFFRFPRIFLVKQKMKMAMPVKSKTILDSSEDSKSCHYFVNHCQRALFFLYPTHNRTLFFINLVNIRTTIQIVSILLQFDNSQIYNQFFKPSFKVFFSFLASFEFFSFSIIQLSMPFKQVVSEIQICHSNYGVVLQFSVFVKDYLTS